MNIKYDRCVCINLESRKDKWNQFLSGMPEGMAVERYPAICGKLVPHPPWWTGGGGAWGCFLSHRRILEECLSRGIQSVLIFEDDCIFCDEFNRKAEEYNNHLPDDAEWVYYGGQHLRQAVQLPERINDYVYRPFNVNRTHAYGIIGTHAMREIYHHLSLSKWCTACHIDHHYGRLHESGKINVYCPSEWLVDQRPGRSDVACREKKETHWADASILTDGRNEPFYAVLGTHSSGSSALAGMMYHLGVHLGNNLVGKYGTYPINGGEAAELQRIFESNARVPVTEYRNENDVKRRLLRWINQKRGEAKSKHTVAAGKYPQLAPICPWLAEQLGARLRIIVCDRPLDESVKSLQRRFGQCSYSQILEHQRWIIHGIQKTISIVGRDNVLRIPYKLTITEPKRVALMLMDFMGIDAKNEQIKNAVNYIDPNLQHVKR